MKKVTFTLVYAVENDAALAKLHEAFDDFVSEGDFSQGIKYANLYTTAAHTENVPD